jgi:hypothetical protein
MISRQEQSLAGFSFDNDPWPYTAENSRRMPGETEMHNGEIVLAGRLRMRQSWYSAADQPPFRRRKRRRSVAPKRLAGRRHK